MHPSCALSILLLALSIPGSGLQTGSAATKSLLVGVTTGSGPDLTSDIVTIDPRDGATERIGQLVLPKGHGRVQSQDLAWSADSKQLLVAELEFQDKGQDKGTRTWLDWVDPATLAVKRSGEVMPGVIDSLCWDGQGRLLATWGNGRPQKLKSLDTQTGAATDLGSLDVRLWVRSLVWRVPQAELWALHTRTPEMPNDALVRLSPQTGATLQVVELSMSETATAFTIDARGEFLVTGGSEGVFTVDISTGKTQRARRNTGVMLTGIVPGR